MSSPLRSMLATAALGVAAVGGLLLWRSRAEIFPHAGFATSGDAAAAPSGPATVAAAGARPDPADDPAWLQGRIGVAVDGLAAHAAYRHRVGNPVEILSTLRADLHRPAPEIAGAAVEAFLAAGGDAETGESFAIARDGFLAAAPTVRTLVLDELERLDRTRALAAARSVLDAAAEAPGSAEEWAVALRIAGRAGVADTPEGRKWFRGRVQALLARPEWLGAPTAGFLHAFDAAVFAGDLATADRLAELTDSRQLPAVQYAARLALDRLVIEEYAEVAGHLLTQATRLSSQPGFRASLLARGDVRNAGDRAVLVRFLLDAGTGDEDLRAWAEGFPNHSRHAANHLMTGNAPLAASERALIDRASLAAVREWRQDRRLARAAPYLAPLEARLTDTVARAGHALTLVAPGGGASRRASSPAMSRPVPPAPPGVETASPTEAAQ